MGHRALVAMTTQLWLVRHCATDWSDAGRFNGWTDVPLNEGGRIGARSLRAGLAGTDFDGVWSSDLSRCLDTARLAGWPKAIPDRLLRELDFGALEGLTWDECSASDREGLLDFDSFAAPDGETTAQLRARVRKFTEQLTPGVHLVFTHGGIIRALVRERASDRAVATGDLVTIDLGATPGTGRTTPPQRRERAPK